MLAVSLFFTFQQHVLTFAMAFARVAIVLYMLPVLGERVLSNMIIKNMVVILIITGLWPCVEPVMAPEQGTFFLLLKEAIAGLVLAVTLCLPFWIAVTLGELLDNQRGATLSDSIDPVNGVQSSVMAGFMNFTFGAIFFAQGGARRIMDVFVQSYHIFPRGGDFSRFTVTEAGACLSLMMQNSIILASPVMIVLMVSEILLGLLARYCPQLNPFSLSLTIKSFIAFGIFLLYGFHTFSAKVLPLFSISTFTHFFQ